MNTPESDMEQMKFAREWVRAHAAKKMAKYEKKTEKSCKGFLRASGSNRIFEAWRDA